MTWINKEKLSTLRQVMPQFAAYFCKNKWRESREREWEREGEWEWEGVICEHFTKCKTNLLRPHRQWLEMTPGNVP